MRALERCGIVLIGIALAAAAAAATPAAKPGSERRYYPVRVDVDTTGTVTAAEPLGETLDALRGQIVAAARNSRFTPAKVDGTPVTVRKTLVVAVDFESTPAGIAARVVGVQPGMVQPFVAPDYPPNAALEGVEARVTLRVAYDAQGRFDAGRTVVESIEGDTQGRPPRHAKKFTEAALAAARAWTFVPDEIDGKPVPVDVRVPVNFCIMGCPFSPDSPRILMRPDGSLPREAAPQPAVPPVGR